MCIHSCKYINMYTYMYIHIAKRALEYVPKVLLVEQILQGPQSK